MRTRLTPEIISDLYATAVEQNHWPQLSAMIALDAMAFGVLICDASARLVWANACAEALGRAGAGIVLAPRGRRLKTFVPRHVERLVGLINRAATGGSGGGLAL